MESEGLFRGSDGKKRCWWCEGRPDYIKYHDEEWGRPQTEDDTLFEKLALEGFQAGLSWYTILKRREAFRQAFEGFRINRLIDWDPEETAARLMNNEDIIRNTGKIKAVIQNARVARTIQEEHGSLSRYIWSFQPDHGQRPDTIDYDTVSGLITSPASDALSSSLKQAGWRYIGSTSTYAFMQSVGMVNDHLETCSFREEVEKERALTLS